MDRNESRIMCEDCGCPKHRYRKLHTVPEISSEGNEGVDGTKGGDVGQEGKVDEITVEGDKTKDGRRDKADLKWSQQESESRRVQFLGDGDDTTLKRTGSKRVRLHPWRPVAQFRT